ncbi:MAG TPA: hypothetical protein VLK65_23045 [Vicinamibacteria bacterium]|nr:hypothetical protein [Vicinamibacteria bacterium]
MTKALVFLRVGLGSLLALAAFACQRTAASDVEMGSGEPSLSHTFETPEELGRAVVDGLVRGDAEALKELPLSKDEFRLFVWPGLPSSRPERGIPFEYAWGELAQKSRASIADTLSRYKGKELTFLAIRFAGDTTDHDTFKVHRDARVRVRREDGTEDWLDLFGSVMEWRGRYKLFSYVTD